MIRLRACLPLFALAAAPAPAAVLTVGASGCDHMTLGAAIAAAQPGDELRLRAQTFSSVSENISMPLTLRGGYAVCGDASPGPGLNSIIEGTGSATVFTIGGGVNSTVELANLEVTGGDGGLFGGGVSVLSGATLRLASTEFHGNAGGSGGAIFVGPDSRLEHSGPVTLRDNLADKGGALYVSGNAVADFTTGGFNAVEINGNAAQEGGGIFINDGGRLATDAEHSLTVRGNQAQAGGGLFAETGAELELVDDVVRENLAAVAGGGLFVSGDGDAVAVPTIHVGEGTVFRLNQAGVGGGAAFGPGGGYNAEVFGEFRNNTAVQNGGGLAISGDGVFDVDSALFSDNSAGTTGGGLDVASAAVLIADRLAASGNRADLDGGGVHLAGLVSLQVSNQFVVRSNAAGRSGGGIVVRDGALMQVTGSLHPLGLLLQGNEAETGDGGGLMVAGGGVDVFDGILGTVGFGNSAPQGSGGGAWIDTDLDWSIRNSWINGNSTQLNGAALFIAGGADFVLGGGPAVAGSSCEPFSDPDLGEYCAEVRGNRADSGGAAIAIVDDAPAVRELLDLAILDNETGNPASAILADAPGIAIGNTLIARNAGSPAVFVGNGRDVRFEHVGLLYNERGMVSGGSADLDIDHSMFWGNGVWDFVAGGGDVINGACNLGRPIDLPDAFRADPRFVTTSRGLYRLSDQSPALDLCSTSLLAADLDGLARPDGAASEVGPFEGGWGTSDVLRSDSFESGPLASPTLPAN